MEAVFMLTFMSLSFKSQLWNFTGLDFFTQSSPRILNSDSFLVFPFWSCSPRRVSQPPWAQTYATSTPSCLQFRPCQRGMGTALCLLAVPLSGHPCWISILVPPTVHWAHTPSSSKNPPGVPQTPMRTHTVASAPSPSTSQDSSQVLGHAGTVHSEHPLRTRLPPAKVGCSVMARICPTAWTARLDPGTKVRK